MAEEDNLDNKKGVNDSISLFKFGNQDLPVFREVKNVDWVYYGAKNDFPYYLIDNYTESAFHKAITDFKVSYICSGGWGINMDGMNTEQKALALKMLEQPFNMDSDLDDATLRWTLDLELFNGLCIKGVWSENEKFATLSYVDMANIRTNIDETIFYYTSKWVTQAQDGTRKPNTKPQEEKDFKKYPKYDNTKRTGEFIYYWKAPHPTQKVYPIPLYQGAMRAISIDIALDKYFHNIVSNGFVPTHLINFFNGEPSAEKSQAIEKLIQKKWSGVNGQPIIVNFAKNKETAADVQTLQMTDADKQYQEVAKASQQKIITGHLLTSGMLLGLYREGSLGGRSELMFAEEMFQNQYVTGRQHIIENIMNELAADFGIQNKFYLTRVRRVGYMFDDATIDSVLTFEEKRQVILDSLGVKAVVTKRGETPDDLYNNIINMQPKIAEVVMTKLSDQEIRAMVGLNSPKVNTTVTQNTVFRFAHEMDLISKFESIAKDYSNSTLLYEREILDFSEDAIKMSEQDFMAHHFAEVIKLNTLERSIVDLLSKDNTLQPEAIAKATKMDVGKVKAALYDLYERGILKSNNIETPTGNVEGYEVTTKGSTALDEKPAKTASLKVVYRYGLSSNFKGEPEILDTSHEFCKKIVKLSQEGKRWESADIFALDMGVEGMDAWTNRGGWYTKPDTNVHVPHCRHSWIQQMVSVITE